MLDAMKWLVVNKVNCWIYFLQINVENYSFGASTQNWQALRNKKLGMLDAMKWLLVNQVNCWSIQISLENQSFRASTQNWQALTKQEAWHVRCNEVIACSKAWSLAIADIALSGCLSNVKHVIGLQQWVSACGFCPVLRMSKSWNSIKHWKMAEVWQSSSAE